MMLAEKLDIFVMMYLDDILIYIKNPSRPYMDPIQCVLE